MALAGLALAVAIGPAGAAPPPVPLPWQRSYIEDRPLSTQEFIDALIDMCHQDRERGLYENNSGGPRIAVVGDSIQGQTRSPALFDPAYHWMYGTHCGEKFGTVVDSGRLADAVNAHPDVLLVALGSNNLSENFQTTPTLLGPALQQLQRFLDATEGVPCRVLYDLPYVVSSQASADASTWLYLTGELNKAIWAAQSRPGVHVAPWRDRIAWNWPAYLQDGMHLTRLGINEKINLGLETARQCLVPDSPPNVGAVAGSGTATVWWDGLPEPEKATSYVVTASDGRSVTTTQRTINFPGLVDGQPYQFRVAAVNGAGTGSPSAWTAPVVPSSAGARFYPSSPVRVLDTRVGTGGKAGSFGPGETYRLPLPTGVVPAGASSVVMNVTATGQSESTFVTVWPGGQAQPLASNLNPRPGVDAVPAMVTSRVGADGSVQLYNNSGRVDLVADVVGWFGPVGDTSGSLFAPVPPVRLLDTRDPTGPKTDAFVGGEVLPLTVEGVPADASSVVLNITAVDTTGPTHLTVWPDGQPRPLASSLNPQRGLTRANLTVAKLGPGQVVDLFNNAASTNVVVDLVGYYTAAGAVTGGSAYHPFTPERAYDTRDGTGGLVGPIGSATNASLLLAGRGAVPAGAVAVDANVTVVGPTGRGHTTVWPAGAKPLASTLNYEPSEVIANRDLVSLSNNRTLISSAAPSIHYVVDVSGWYGPAQ